ncbi:unnamed protein product [Arabis nemorensis]|uniref:Uncharacterized protein n=1 Tax=Arabis nemorensis TaxID=586526 RepID=A0A565BVM6_9BRAS|nr:unnamed protein product [Arabis nemorensis]
MVFLISPSQSLTSPPLPRPQFLKPTVANLTTTINNIISEKHRRHAGAGGKIYGRYKSDRTRLWWRGSGGMRNGKLMISEARRNGDRGVNRWEIHKVMEKLFSSV